MSQRIFVAALALAAFGCREAPTELVEQQRGPAFSAQVETLFQQRVPLGPRTTFNDCTGEYVDIVGEYNLVVRQVTTPGGKVHFFIHSVGVHVNGIGQTTGTEYVSNEHFNYVSHEGPNGATILVIEFTIRTVAKGSAPNAAGKLQTFLVINANGEVTVDRVVFDFDSCK